MRLFLCEKPSQARDIGKVLGATSKGDGCLNGQNVSVTWCFGHLLEMANPEDYNPDWKQWQMNALPMLPEQWKLTVRKDAAKQYKAIAKLLKQANEVVIATDADREGEIIAREVMALAGYRGPTYRLWLAALDEASVRKALADLWPGERTAALYQAGLARGRADWLVGMNMTRAYTLAARQGGYDQLLSVGRVQTPTLRLVVDRDLEIEHFTPVPYFVVTATFAVQSGQFVAQWQVPENIADDEGRCVQQAAAQAVAQKINGQTGQVTKAETQRKQEGAPLLFSLSSLQQEASRRYGLGAQKVLDIAQSLYETHKATTYPRTDCGYLPQSQFAEAPQVLAAMSQSDSAVTALCEQADTSLTSKAWNDKKITAHHGIIPTTTATDISNMSEVELKLYDLIRRRYLTQFYPAFEYDQTSIEVTVAGECFGTTGRVTVNEGWCVVMGKPPKDTDADEVTTDNHHQSLPAMRTGENATVQATDMAQKQTKPPARFTEGTLIQAMKSIGKYVEDPRLKKVLKETSGIGTEATRASIIETVLKRGFVTKQKKYLVSTAAGRALIQMLPPQVKDPAMTALWEQSLEQIAAGQGTLDAFMERQTQWVTQVVKHVQQQGGVQLAGVEQHPCPNCQKSLRRRKGSKGWFWACTGYPDCKTTLPDARGKPGKPKAAEPSGGKVYPCPDCQQPMRRIKGNKGHFWGCTGYPNCKATLPDVEGKPGKKSNQQ